MPSLTPGLILVLYNGMPYLPACFEALAPELAAVPGAELVVVDNASSDGSAEWVAAHVPAARLLRNTRNLGFAAACNQGAAAAAGEVLVFLNQDTRVLPGWLSALLAGLALAPDVGLTTSQLLVMHQPNRIQLCGQALHYTGLVAGSGAQCQAGALNASQPVGSVSGASFAILRALWEQLGGFDEAFFMYYEESDLSWRASLLGYTSWCIPGSQVLHAAAPEPAPGARYWMLRNRPLLLLKHWKWTTLLFISPALAAVELAEWLALLRLGPRHLGLKLRASAWLWTHLRLVWRARRRAQAYRQVSDAAQLAQCAVNLAPQGSTYGAAPGVLTRALNIILSLNYRLALRILEKLQI